MKTKGSRNKYTLISVLTIVLLVVLWEVSVQLGWVGTNKLPALSTVISTFVDKLTNTSPDGATIMQHLAASLKIVFTGFLCAVVIGIPLGLSMGFFRTAEAILSPIFEILRPIPCMAWVPIVLLLAGIGPTGKIFIIFISSFVSVTINTYTGIRRTKQVLLNVAKTAGASKWQMFVRVGIPSAVPMMFTGLRLSLSAAMATLVAAEMVAATRGVGYMMSNGRRLMRTELVFLGVIICGLLGFLANYLMSLLERKVAPWQEEH